MILAHFNEAPLDRRLDESRLFKLSTICLFLLELQKVLCLCSQVDSEGLHWLLWSQLAASKTICIHFEVVRLRVAGSQS